MTLRYKIGNVGNNTANGVLCSLLHLTQSSLWLQVKLYYGKKGLKINSPNTLSWSPPQWIKIIRPAVGAKPYTDRRKDVTSTQSTVRVVYFLQGRIKAGE